MRRMQGTIQRRADGRLISPREIRDERARRGITQTELAELMNLSLRTIMRYENGGTIPYHVALSLRRFCDQEI